MQDPFLPNPNEIQDDDDDQTRANKRWSHLSIVTSQQPQLDEHRKQMELLARRQHPDKHIEQMVLRAADQRRHPSEDCVEL